MKKIHLSDDFRIDTQGRITLGGYLEQILQLGQMLIGDTLGKILQGRYFCSNTPLVVTEAVVYYSPRHLSKLAHLCLQPFIKKNHKLARVGTSTEVFELRAVPCTHIKLEPGMGTYKIRIHHSSSLIIS